MEERILELKNLYDNGITRNIFFGLISHCTNGPVEYMSQYSNNLTLAEWFALFSAPFVNIGVSENQLELFFEYMRKYSSPFFGKNQNHYFVNKSFTNDEKQESNFEFEVILMTSFEIL